MISYENRDFTSAVTNGIGKCGNIIVLSAVDNIGPKQNQKGIFGGEKKDYHDANRRIQNMNLFIRRGITATKAVTKKK